MTVCEGGVACGGAAIDGVCDGIGVLAVGMFSTIFDNEGLPDGDGGRGVVCSKLSDELSGASDSMPFGVSFTSVSKCVGVEDDGDGALGAGTYSSSTGTLNIFLSGILGCSTTWLGVDAVVTSTSSVGSKGLGNCCCGLSSSGTSVEVSRDSIRMFSSDLSFRTIGVSAAGRISFVSGLSKSSRSSLPNFLSSV